MNKYKHALKLISLVLICFFSLQLFSGCSSNDSSDSGNKKNISDRIFVKKKPSASGKNTLGSNGAIIDISNKKDGYVMVAYKKKSSSKFKVLVNYPDGDSCNYDLKSGGEYITVPLTEGNGTYTIGVYKNVSGTQYATVYSTNISVKLKSAFTPFLLSSEYVKFDENSEVVKVAEDITDGETDQLKIIETVYNYITDNIEYDNDFATKVKNGQVSGYIPDPDEVLDSGKGICFDYAVVMTAMLRSQDIPTKLLIGYTGDVYHAWVNVYSKETGKIDKVIKFSGKKYVLMDPTFSASYDDEKKLAEYMGDGNKYQEKYVY